MNLVTLLSVVAIGVALTSTALSQLQDLPPQGSGDKKEKPAPPAGSQFRIKFQAYDGDPKKPGSMAFQINTLDVRQPTVFIMLGDTIPKTKLRLAKFEQKHFSGPNTEEDDISELTVVNVETKEATVLVISKVMNIPAAKLKE
jgi:hypothetical protein